MATTQEKSKLDTLKQKLQSQIDDARKKLDEMKQELAKANAQNRDELIKMRDKIHQRVEAQGKKMGELRDNLQAWQKEKAAHTKETISGWRQKMEVDKLRRRADRAEDSAVDALFVAMVDADAAEEAVLEAISARIDFETTTPG
jgi:uncharacterized coiled-coil DUF342 family protein